jgi:hypothetical protein
MPNPTPRRSKTKSASKAPNKEHSNQAKDHKIRLKEIYDRLIVPGNWEGEIVGPSSISIGGFQQQVTHKCADELSSCFLIAFARPPESKMELPFILTLLTGKKDRYVYPASFQVSDSMTLMLHLFTNRKQFSDLIHFADQGRLGPLLFSLDGSAMSWTVPSWSIQLRRSPAWRLG